MSSGGSVPGVRFETATAPRPSQLPPMDVAAFVGFAESGPLNTPVLVEDPRTFREIFGEDLPLAWNPAAGQIHRGFLGPAVRAFFRGGGRRCWVVRVAGPSALANRFVLPGLMAVDAGVGYSAVDLQARSEGAWSDDLTVTTSLNLAPGGGAKVNLLPGGRAEVVLSPEFPGTVQAGDLIRLRSEDSQGQLLAYLAVDRVITEGGQSTRLVTGRIFGFRPLDAAANGPATGEGAEGPLLYQPAETLSGHPGRLYFTHPPAEEGRRFLVCPLGGSTVLFAIARTEAIAPFVSEGVTYTAMAVVSEALRPVTVPDGSSLWTAALVTFTLWVDDGSAVYRLDGLGFTSGHPRFAGYLPTDAMLYANPALWEPRGNGPLPGSALWPDVRSPRFPLAGTSLGPGPQVFLPIGMEMLFSRSTMTQPSAPTKSIPTRNGLDHFDPGVFLDPLLATVSAAQLPSVITQRVEDLQVERAQQQSQNPRWLSGIYALWPVEEVTLVALPDAVHPPWRTRSLTPRAAPTLVWDSAAGLLTWNGDSRAIGYHLEIAADAEFARLLKHEDPVDNQCPLFPGPQAGELRFVRVRARYQPEGYLPPLGPWSATVALTWPGADFTAPPESGPAPPVLSLNLGHLDWTGEPDTEYEVEAAGDPDFRSGHVLYRGPYLGPLRAGDWTYFRAQARRGGRSGPWSATITAPDPTPLLMVGGGDPGPGEELRDLHAALLRLCQARSDMLAILALPQGTRAQTAAEYVRQLEAVIPNEERVGLSYAALYFPWLKIWEGTATGIYPPDGTLVGLIAGQSRKAGAWVPAANIPLPGVLDMIPVVPPDVWSDLVVDQINTVCQHGQVYLLLSADTLSERPETRPISVRLLLIYLRRLLLIQATRLTFEPNTDGFRQVVQVQVQAILQQLFVSGALAGDTPAEAYQVVLDPADTSQAYIDQGLFVVDIRIAPSRPLEFITVRLVGAGGGQVAITEG